MKAEPMKRKDRQEHEQDNPTAALPEFGARLVDKSAAPDEDAVRLWIGPQAFSHWKHLRNWINESYPKVFIPEWLHGGKKRGWTLRYKNQRAFCTLLPGYRTLSALVVLGRIERDKFEERRHFWRPQLIKLYDETYTYHDGKWLTVTIGSANDRDELIELVSMKRPPAPKG